MGRGYGERASLPVGVDGYWRIIDATATAAGAAAVAAAVTAAVAAAAGAAGPMGKPKPSSLLGYAPPPPSGVGVAALARAGALAAAARKAGTAPIREPVSAGTTSAGAEAEVDGGLAQSEAAAGAFAAQSTEHSVLLGAGAATAQALTTLVWK